MATAVDDDNLGSPGVTADESITVPATRFAGPSLSAFFRNLKQHAQALFSLIALVDGARQRSRARSVRFPRPLGAALSERGPVAPSCPAPLTDVANLLLDHYSGTGRVSGAGPDAPEQAPCPLSPKPVRHIAFSLEHWLEYTYTVGLGPRLSALHAEEEVEQLRELSKGERGLHAVVSGRAQGAAGLLAAGRQAAALLFPQDRCYVVLAQLSSDLCGTHVLDVPRAEGGRRARTRARVSAPVPGLRSSIPVTLREMQKHAGRPLRARADGGQH
ncbi:MAG: hypothetical protein M1826_005304 [Phylliscum demangeonii]|nr:MAG: hypothetical protein M1826_005304 [Phylliscum demangeonii]